MKSASELFEDTLIWLRDNYANFRFFAERDVVWTIQNQLIEQIAESQFPFRVFNDYPMLKGNRRSLSADLAILDIDNIVQVAMEFKYEPAHSRGGLDILQTKFPVVFWDEVGKDIDRIHEFVSQKKAQQAYSIFIDEGGSFQHRPAHLGSEWIAWRKDINIWILFAHAGENTAR